MSKNRIIAIVLVIAATLGSYYYYEHSKVQITEVLEGIGGPVKMNDTVVFDYRGFLFDANAPKNLGKEIDSSYSRHQPMRAVLGQKQIIPGLERAILGMKAGGQRFATLDSSVAYGDKESAGGLIPANSKLVYLIELKVIE